MHAVWLGLFAASVSVSQAQFGVTASLWLHRLAATLAGMCFALARYHRSRLWDAVTAHLSTKLLLGLYVLLGGQWCYW